MNKRIKVITQLRVVGIAEGISYLILLFVAMPLKYFWSLPAAVLVNGWVHGVLFVLYGAAVINTWIQCNWTFKKACFAGIVSLLPFGTFWFDKKLKTEVEMNRK